MSRYKMYNYELLKPVGTKSYYLKIYMGDTYSPIIEECFPNIKFKWKKIEKGAYECSVPLEEENKNQLRQLLDLFKSHVLLKLNRHISKHFSNELDECFALDYNLYYNEITDETSYTVLGQLEHDAKELRNSRAITQLALTMSDFCVNHPNYLSGDTICAIPQNPSEKFHLPTILVERVANDTTKENGTSYIRKKADTAKAQGLRVDEKIKPLQSVLTINNGVKGKRIILIDDLYQSGSTMWTVAKALKQQGAKKVFGLVCVKSWRDTEINETRYCNTTAF